MDISFQSGTTIRLQTSELVKRRGIIVSNVIIMPRNATGDGIIVRLTPTDADVPERDQPFVRGAIEGKRKITILASGLKQAAAVFKRLLDDSAAGLEVQP